MSSSFQIFILLFILLKRIQTALHDHTDFINIERSTGLTGAHTVLLSYIDANGQHRFIYTPDGLVLHSVSSRVFRTQDWSNPITCTTTKVHYMSEMAINKWYVHSSGNSAVLCNFDVGSEIKITKTTGNTNAEGFAGTAPIEGTNFFIFGSSSSQSDGNAWGFKIDLSTVISGDQAQRTYLLNQNVGEIHYKNNTNLVFTIKSDGKVQIFDYTNTSPSTVLRSNINGLYIYRAINSLPKKSYYVASTRNKDIYKFSESDFSVINYSGVIHTAVKYRKFRVVKETTYLSFGSQSPRIFILETENCSILHVINFAGHANTVRFQNVRQLHNSNLIAIMSRGTGVLYMLDMRLLFNNCALYESEFSFKCVGSCTGGSQLLPAAGNTQAYCYYCHQDCKTCSGPSSSDCSSCESDMVFSGSTCTACASNEVVIANDCSPCGVNEIIIANACSPCASNEIVKNGICVKIICPNRFFIDQNKVCSLCPEGCASCYLRQDKVTACKDREIALKSKIFLSEVLTLYLNFEEPLFEEEVNKIEVKVNNITVKTTHLFRNSGKELQIQLDEFTDLINDSSLQVSLKNDEDPISNKKGTKVINQLAIKETISFNRKWRSMVNFNFRLLINVIIFSSIFIIFIGSPMSTLQYLNFLFSLKILALININLPTIVVELISMMDLSKYNLFKLIFGIEENKFYCYLHPKLSINGIQCVGLFNSSIEFFILMFFLVYKILVYFLTLLNSIFNRKSLKVEDKVSDQQEGAKKSKILSLLNSLTNKLNNVVGLHVYIPMMEKIRLKIILGNWLVLIYVKQNFGAWSISSLILFIFMCFYFFGLNSLIIYLYRYYIHLKKKGSEMEEKILSYEQKYPNQVKLIKQQVRESSRFSIFYLIILLIRDFGFTFVLIFLVEYPLVPILSGLILYFIQSSYIFFLRPRASLKLNVLEFVNSFGNFLVLILFLALFLTESIISEEVKEILIRLPILFILLMIFGCNTGIMTISSILKIIKTIKSIMKKKKESKDHGNSSNFSFEDNLPVPEQPVLVMKTMKKKIIKSRPKLRFRNRKTSRLNAKTMIDSQKIKNNLAPNTDNVKKAKKKVKKNKRNV